MEVPAHAPSPRRIALVVGIVLAAAIALLVITGVLSLSLSLVGPTGDTPPQGGFHVNGDENVTIRHDVGKPVNASRLVIHVNDERRGTWHELSGDTETVEVGDEVTIHGLASNDTVSLYWIGSETTQKLVSRMN